MTKANPTFECIAERELEYREKPDCAPRKAIVRLGRPYFEPPPAEEAAVNSGSWVGPFEIEVDGVGIRSSQAYGMDGVQALHLAMVKVGLDLHHTYPGQFNIEGGHGGESGFPSK